MKFRLFFILLLFFGTTLSAMHTTEHIKAEHEHASCSICVIASSFASGDVIANTLACEKIHFEAIASQSSHALSHAKRFTYNAQAPPLFS